MYHELERAGRPLCSTDAGYVRYVVAESDFRAQMEHIAASGKRGVGVSAWLDGDAASAVHSVVITFDDGCETDLVAAAPILREYGFGATCYLTVDFLGRPGFLSRAQVRDLAATGLEIGCHSMSHAFLSDLDDGALHREVVESKRELEQIAGVVVRSFSCPGGRFDERLLPLARTVAYDSVTTSRTVWNEHRRPPGLLGRFAIVRDMEMPQFIATLDGRDVRARRLRASVLGAAKSLLGNSLYEKLRSRMLQ